jgi:hypothetical protein
MDCIFLLCVALPLTSLRQRDIPPAQCVFHANLAFVLLVQICVILDLTLDDENLAKSVFKDAN